MSTGGYVTFFEDSLFDYREEVNTIYSEAMFNDGHYTKLTDSGIRCNLAIENLPPILQIKFFGNNIIYYNPGGYLFPFIAAYQEKYGFNKIRKLAELIFKAKNDERYYLFLLNDVRSCNNLVSWAKECERNKTNNINDIFSFSIDNNFFKKMYHEEYIKNNIILGTPSYTNLVFYYLYDSDPPTLQGIIDFNKLVDIEKSNFSFDILNGDEYRPNKRKRTEDTLQDSN